MFISKKRTFSQPFRIEKLFWRDIYAQAELAGFRTVCLASGEFSKITENMVYFKHNETEHTREEVRTLDRGSETSEDFCEAQKDRTIT